LLNIKAHKYDSALKKYVQFVKKNLQLYCIMIRRGTREFAANHVRIHILGLGIIILTGKNQINVPAKLDYIRVYVFQYIQNNVYYVSGTYL
jgi:hypothetical protein